MELAQHVAVPLELVRTLARLEPHDPLAAYPAAMTDAVADLLAAGTDPLVVTQAVALANDALTSRLLELAEERLGPPPYAYCWLALGSHGRGEQVLSSDQDSALAYGGPRLADGDPAAYFAELARLVVDGLTRAGVPPCPGGYMATVWCHHLETFEGYFRRWVDDPLPGELLRAEVFLDVRPVHGDLAVDSLGELLVTGGRRGGFLMQMARAAVTFHPPLVVLGHVRTDHGHLDLKRSGTAAIVLLARLYALAAGSAARTTLLRLQAAGEAGTLSADGVERLVDGYRFLTGLRLSHQVSQVREGAPPDDRLRPGALTDAERRRLRSTIRAVRVVQEITENRYRTHTVS